MNQNLVNEINAFGEELAANCSKNKDAKNYQKAVKDFMNEFNQKKIFFKEASNGGKNKLSFNIKGDLYTPEILNKISSDYFSDKLRMSFYIFENEKQVKITFTWLKFLK